MLCVDDFLNSINDGRVADHMNEKVNTLPCVQSVRQLLELVCCFQQGPRLGAPDADELLARRQHRRRLVHLLSRREPAAVARIPSNTLTTC